jgi:NADH-quinone oxidoreductase subunit G
MCLVEVEKMPKMMTACTLPVSEGMVVRTETEQVKQARKYTLEFLLTNHPLDCPVCDKGGECELQDMVFRYGAGRKPLHGRKSPYSGKAVLSRWSTSMRPAASCASAASASAMRPWESGALGVVNRGVVSEIAPNVGDHLECDECGACIDICPVGAR